jgi:hypothetical protein
MLQATKIRTSRELYLYCIHVEYQTMLLPRFDYKFSMDRRKEAAQATIEEFVKSTISLKSDKRNVYSDSDSGSCGDQEIPSPTLLKKLLMGYPILNLYILDFIF